MPKGSRLEKYIAGRKEEVQENSEGRTSG